MEFAGYRSCITELELSHDVGPTTVGSEVAATVDALASAGIPMTISRLCCPPANVRAPNALRSVKVCGADQTETGGVVAVVGGALSDEGETVTISVTVEGTAVTLRVVRRAVTVVVV
jgi:hypothetical protein